MREKKRRIRIKMITRNDVEKGYKDGAVRLIESPHGDGTVCRIGENWFYFGGLTAEEHSPKEYEKYVPKEDIIQEIYDTLDDMRSDEDTFGDEYRYYEAVLAEASAAMIRVRRYTAAGDTEQDFFFDGIRAALAVYAGIRDAVPDCWERTTLWPTIWVRTDRGFLRVHDYAFRELTEGNVAKYLAERVLDTDGLLAGVPQ
ncbi:MAG: hypothetical protein NC489_41935 [Ruminococcus flavefaciens]|nr:hypothetical protein [Ruminococcus flavefaciens]